MACVVGVDPGVATGLCRFDGEQLVDGAVAMDLSDLEAFILKQRPDVVVIEDFIIGRRSSRAKEPLEVIGAVKYLCHSRGINLVTQSPVILQGMLKHAQGLHDNRHVRSACAHVIHYLWKSEDCVSRLTKESHAAEGRGSSGAISVSGRR